MASRFAGLEIFQPGSTNLITKQQSALTSERITDVKRAVNNCELCLREHLKYTIHHLIPRAKGGNHGPKSHLCQTCHKQIHSMFTENTLAKDLYSIKLLKSNTRVNKFVKWIRKQKRTHNFKVRKARIRE